MIALKNCAADESRCGLPQPGIGEEIPNRRVGVSYRDDHQISVRGKFSNISARFRSISSADGAGPYLASNPHKDRVGSLPLTEVWRVGNDAINGLSH